MWRNNLRGLPRETARQMPKLRTLNETPFSVPIFYLFFHSSQILSACNFHRPAFQLQTPCRIETMFITRTFLRMTYSTAPTIFACFHGTLAHLNLNHLLLLNNILFLIVLKFYHTIPIESAYRTQNHRKKL